MPKFRACLALSLGFPFLACGGGGSGPGGTSALPVISSFSATPARITNGQSTTLRWSVTNATSLSLSPGIGTVTGDSITVLPAPAGSQSVTYLLTATNAQGISTASATVTLSQTPVVDVFTANHYGLSPGSGATLTAAFHNGTARIDPGIGAVSSPATIAVSPVSETTYTLTVTNPAGATAAVSFPIGFDASTQSLPTGNPVDSERSYFTATLLPGGSVLIAGGPPAGDAAILNVLHAPYGLASTAGAMVHPRMDHAAVLLPSGKVLLVGGASLSGTLQPEAELYDPATGAFAATGSLQTARVSPTATLLPDGTVLVAGGLDAADTRRADAEIYDPVHGTFAAASGNMSAGRCGHTATLLANGKVLLLGGEGGSSASGSDLYDPTAGAFTRAGDLSTHRVAHTATLLGDGRVLVAGGSGVSAAAELFDPATGTFSLAGSLRFGIRSFHTAVLEAGGKVLLSGGSVGHIGNLSMTCERFDPATGQFSIAHDMFDQRMNFVSLLLPDGEVLHLDGPAYIPYQGPSFELLKPAD